MMLNKIPSGLKWAIISTIIIALIDFIIIKKVSLEGHIFLILSGFLIGGIYGNFNKYWIKGIVIGFSIPFFIFLLVYGGAINCGESMGCGLMGLVLIAITFYLFISMIILMIVGGIIGLIMDKGRKKNVKKK